MLPVEIVYVPLHQQMIHVRLTLPLGATVVDALSASGLLTSHPEITSLSIGVFSKAVSLNTTINAGDRIEIYQPLQLDPKDKRRERALRTVLNFS